LVSRSRRFPSPLNILRIWPRKSHNFALDSCRFYGMGLPMKRNSDHPGIPATWAAAPEDTGDCRFPSSPVALPPMRHGSRDCGTKPRCHPEPVERVALSPTSALNSSPSALPATRAPFVTSPHLTKTDWIWLDLPGFAWIPLRIFPRHDASPQPKTARSRGSRVLTLSPIHLVTPSSPSRIYLDLPGFGRPHSSIHPDAFPPFLSKFSKPSRLCAFPFFEFQLRLVPLCRGPRCALDVSQSLGCVRSSVL